MTVSEPESGNAPPITAASRKSSFAQLSIQRERPRYNPVYGRFVGIAKFCLPIIATALIVAIAVWPELSEQSRFSLKASAVDRSDAENLQMLNARFTGVDTSRRPFAVTADSADQSDVMSPDIALDAPKADILLGNGTWVALTATIGNFNREQQLLELTGNVNLFHDRGYEFRTKSAVFDLTAGDAIGIEPVEGQGPFGHLKAEGFRIFNRGERVEFTGKSQLTIKPYSGKLAN